MKVQVVAVLTVVVVAMYGCGSKEDKQIRGKKEAPNTEENFNQFGDGKTGVGSSPGGSSSSSTSQESLSDGISTNDQNSAPKVKDYASAAQKISLTFNKSAVLDQVLYTSNGQNILFLIANGDFKTSKNYQDHWKMCTIEANKKYSRELGFSDEVVEVFAENQTLEVVWYSNEKEQIFTGDGFEVTCLGDITDEFYDPISHVEEAFGSKISLKF